MAVDIEVRGSAELRRAARQLREQDKAIDRHIDRAWRGLGHGFQADIRAGIPRYVPSGYAPVLAPATRVVTSIRRASGAGLSFRVFATGKKDERDIRALNAGILRHPVHGHRDRWVTQKVKAGMVDDPKERLADRAMDAMTRAVDEAIAKLARG